MEKKELEGILTAPLTVVKPASEDEKIRSMFMFGSGEGEFYTFGLASGISFVGRIPQKEKNYEFIVLDKGNTGVDLFSIVWKAKEDIADLGYTTKCTCMHRNKEEYEEILAPKPAHAPYLTKIAFRYYSYHPLLQRAILLQDVNQKQQEIEKTLLEIKKRKEALLTSDDSSRKNKDCFQVAKWKHEGKQPIQNKLQERRQNG